MNFYRLKDGRMTDIWTEFDGVAMMQQLDAIPVRRSSQLPGVRPPDRTTCRPPVTVSTPIDGGRDDLLPGHAPRRGAAVPVGHTRTNAGVDNISTYRKLHVFRPGDDRLFVLQSAGSLATTHEV